jgi:hypothetical protein
MKYTKYPYCKFIKEIILKTGSKTFARSFSYALDKSQPLEGVSLFSEGTTYGASFREVLSIKHRNLIKIVEAAFERIEILFLGPYFKEPF